jgi:hypothetical protein
MRRSMSWKMEWFGSLEAGQRAFMVYDSMGAGVGGRASDLLLQLGPYHCIRLLGIPRLMCLWPGLLPHFRHCMLRIASTSAG